MHVRRCYYCGEEISRPPGVAFNRWWHRNRVFCCKDHYHLTQGVDEMGYLGFFLKAEGITFSQFISYLGKYMTTPLKTLIEYSRYGVPHGGGGAGKRAQLPAEHIALNIGCAVSDMLPRMQVPGGYFDYRKVLRPREAGIMWAGGDGVKGAMKTAGLDIENIIQIISQGNGEFHRRKNHGLNQTNRTNACRSFLEDFKGWLVDEMYDSSWTWQKMLREMAENKKYPPAKMAYDLSEFISRYDKHVDYRMMLKEYLPQDFKSQFKKNILMYSQKKLYRK